MNVLVIGSGAREHALAWKISQSPLCSRLYVAPGNAGTELDAENVSIDVDDFSEIARFASQNKVELVVVGPEQPLCEGIVDVLSEQGIRAFGPTRAAAQLEKSKVFCKRALRAADVPTGDFHVFQRASDAENFVQQRFPADQDPQEIPLVVKADGLAAGKGAIVCSTRSEVFEAIERVARKREFGKAGDQFIIEERLSGEEASVMAITDGRTVLTLPAVQDHKRALDGDLGPNTGGMGTYCPAPIITPEIQAWIEERVLVPTIHYMNRTRARFRGVLFAGLMLTSTQPKVLEYNVRFGDPECQTILMRLKSDLLEIMLATVDERLHEISVPEWDERPAVCVVMASEGYPDKYRVGHEIRGLDEASKIENTKVFHAGTRRDGDKVVTSGGRVLAVTALGNSIAAAKLQAYKAVKCIRWEGAWCRKDIADKALAIQLK
ncbi:MAG TPA: phosphoribosylamine--glycine ligase [Pirellulaceae bacterium]|nr:phosphoribosylamine--glycine ligase [Pirellulaceae bacterium]HMO94078.1 phosphoribosylamine--glycine ligase [Pirellulaceae bacterium]HMP71151.1 phosphoribosylamine--glycine ligase [Pirellulaceae bacterium]